MSSLYLNADHIFTTHQDTPEHQSEGEENLQNTPPPQSPTIQVWFHLLSKYLNFSMILNLVLFPFGFIRYSIHLQLPGNPGRTLHWYRYDFRTWSWIYSVYFWQSSFSLPTMHYLNYLASQILQSQALHRSLRPYWLQFKRNTFEASKYLFLWLISLYFLSPSAILISSSF